MRSSRTTGLWASLFLIAPATPLLAQAPPPENAPPPGEESGRIDELPEDSVARQVGRGVLVVPRAAVEIAMMPVRGTVWAFERYHIIPRLRSVFYTDDGTFGIVPNLLFETDYGLNVGGKLVWHTGPGEGLSLSAGTGGRFRNYFEAAVRTGQRIPGVVLEGRVSYEQRPQDRFYGIGNLDETGIIPEMPVDPAFSDTSVETTYRRQRARASLSADIPLVAHLHLRPAAALADVELGSADKEVPIDEVYAPSDLTGFMDGYRLGYGELELRWDTRQSATRWEPTEVPGTGTMLAGYAGYALVDPGDSFWRVGVDVAHYLRIASGPRVLETRLHAEAITGDTEDVPFTELPMLGGGRYLRGYPIERFRDRAAVVGTLEYEFDLSRMFLASVFTDVGRVFPSITDLSFDDLRAGFGVALEAHSDAGFVTRVSLASSIDGGAFVNLYFEPGSSVPPRVERR